MKVKLNRLSQRYVTALRKYLKPGPRASLQPALRLGRQAVALGLETLELARIHEQALGTLELSNRKNGAIKRAGKIFHEAVTPIVETHRAARQSKIELHRLNEKLIRRTLELATTNRRLLCSIVRRKSVEAALKISGIHYTRRLKDSLQLQAGLRQLTHRAQVAQEEERKKMSIELQDEIASTQRLVVKSANSVRRVAREFTNA